MMLGIKGNFIVNGQRIPNIIPNGGEEAFIKMIVQDDDTVVSGSGNFYLGLCTNANVSATAVLSDLAEMSGGGYARKAIERTAVGWPTIDVVNGIYRGLSKTVNFAASGAAIGPYNRAFLCNVVSGTSGVLLAISGEFPSAQTIADGQDQDIAYELFLGYTG